MEIKKPEGNINISPMSITSSPLRKDLVGDAGKFVDNFIKATESELIYKVMGTEADRSFLITGAPGNGKTVAIEALVNEINQEAYLKYMANPGDPSEFKLLGFEYDIGKYGTKYINEGSRIVQSFFDVCFKVADSGHKALVIFDEAEVLFGKRLNSNASKEDTKVLNTIMKNMQRLHFTDNIYTVMMSNFPEAFDEASIRAGRVDQKYEFKNPTSEERTTAYRCAISKINNKAGYKVVRECNAERLSKLSDNFNYSDIVESVNSAVKLKVKEISNIPQNGIIDLNLWITEKRVRDAIINHKKTFIENKSKRRIGFQ